MKKTFLLLPLTLALLAATAAAQDRSAPVQKTPPTTERVQVERLVLDEVKTVARETALGRTADLAAVENLLVELNEAEPGSAEWRLETAQRLMQLADQMAREGRAASIPKLTARALDHLRLADSPANDLEVRAAAKSLSAFIQERYLGDASSARASYQAAAALSPQDKSAQENAGRLERKEAAERQKPQR